MTKIVSLANQKGGVGKTTSTINLAASLGLADKKVLLIDLDPQGNATMGSGVNKYQVNYSSNDVLLGNVSLKEAIVKTHGGYDLLPANGDLTIAEVKLITQPNRETALHRAIESFKQDKTTINYDFILIDCPPALNLLTVNAFTASDSVLIPIQCEYYALEGLTALLDTIEQLVQSVNPQLKVEGILRTMFDGRNRLAQDVSVELLKHFDHLVYRTVIPRNVRLAEAPSHGLPIVIYDKSSQGAAAYSVLAEEFLKHQVVREEAVC